MYLYMVNNRIRTFVLISGPRYTSPPTSQRKRKMETGKIHMSPSLLFSILASSCIFIFFLYKLLSSFKSPKAAYKSKKLPPSPPKLPVIGNFHQLGNHPHHSLHAFAKKYGPVMLLHLGGKPVLVVSSVETAKEIMKTQDLNFSSRPKSTPADRLLYGSKDVALSPYGEYWRQVRSICVLQLLSVKRVQAARNIRDEETRLLLEKTLKQSRSGLVDMSSLFVTLTKDILCRVAFGKKYNEDEGDFAKKVKHMFMEQSDLMGSYYIGDFIPWLGWVTRFNGLDARIAKLSKDFDELLEGVVAEHKAKPKKEKDDDMDFVDILLQVQRDHQTGFKLEDDAVKALIMDMFIAGTDTTHSVLEWAMSELLRNPKVMEKLQNEVRQASRGKPDIAEEDLDNMPYLKAVVKEALRLHPPLPLLIPRESMKETKVMGYHVDSGTQVLVSVWAVSRDPTIWEKPEQFMPERFLERNIDFKGFDFEFTPFGTGRRGCPGVAFGIAVNELTLARVVHRFNFQLPNGMKPEDLDMTEGTGLTVHRKSPLCLVATPFVC